MRTKKNSIVKAREYFYIALSRGLQGYYICVLAPDIWIVRDYARLYYDKNFTSVYTPADISKFMSVGWKVKIINEDEPVSLGMSPQID